MPPTTRILVRRDLAQAEKRINKIMDYLARSGSLYEQDHHNTYLMFCALITIANMLKEGLIALRSHL